MYITLIYLQVHVHTGIKLFYMTYCKGTKLSSSCY